jgi:hypothetical protein
VISKTEQFALAPSFPKDVAGRLLQVWPVAQNPEFRRSGAHDWPEKGV